jgi:hypothetical protein
MAPQPKTVIICLTDMKMGFLLLCMFAGTATQAQVQDTLHTIRHRQMALQKTTGIVLGSWGLANTLSGAIGMSTAEGSNQYFHQMNFAWGLVNTGLAIAIRHSAAKEARQAVSYGSVLKYQQQVEKLLLLNTGLDAAYMATGWALIEKSRHSTNKPERLEGFGQSLLLQGGFLLLFDLVQYGLHRKNGKALQSLSDRIQLGPASQGIGMTLSF